MATAMLRSSPFSGTYFRSAIPSYLSAVVATKFPRPTDADFSYTSGYGRRLEGGETGGHEHVVAV